MGRKFSVEKKCVVLYFDSTLNHFPLCKEAIKKHQLKDKRFAKNIKSFL